MVVTVMLVLGALPLQVAKPEALVKFEQARMGLRTGRIMATVVGGPGVIGMPAHRYGMEMARNGDVLHSYYGDMEGVLARDVYGYPVIPGGARTLVQDEVVWHKQEQDLAGEIVPRADYSLGREPPFWGNADLRTIGSIHRVTVHCPDEREMVYEIDEAKGWNATRIGGVDSRGEWECLVELGESRGVWFPETVVLSRNGRTETEWLVAEAEFNSPNDPEGLGPADIGLEVGMGVSIRRRKATGKHVFTSDGWKYTAPPPRRRVSLLGRSEGGTTGRGLPTD